MAEKFIQKAIKHPGALRATAKRLGLIHGDEPITGAVLDKLEDYAESKNNPTLKRRVAFARQLARLRKRRHKG